MRAQDRPSRHALYEAGSYCLDLQLEQQPAFRAGHADRPARGPEQAGDEHRGRARLADGAEKSGGQHPVQSVRRVSAGIRARARPRLHVPLRAAGKRLEVSLDRLTPGLPGRAAPGENRAAGKRDDGRQAGNKRRCERASAPESCRPGGRLKTLFRAISLPATSTFRPLPSVLAVSAAAKQAICKIFPDNTNVLR